jgi:uncharacterized DUF497 family protein
VPFFFFVWTPDRLDKIEQHGVEPDDFEAIVQDPHHVAKSRSSDRFIAFGYSSDDRWTACVFERLDDDTILPITAYFPGEE